MVAAHRTSRYPHRGVCEFHCDPDHVLLYSTFRLVLGFAPRQQTMGNEVALRPYGWFSIAPVRPFLRALHRPQPTAQRWVSPAVRRVARHARALRASFFLPPPLAGESGGGKILLSQPSIQTQ